MEDDASDPVAQQADSGRETRAAMASHSGALRCSNCGIEIDWSFIVVDGKPYCCRGCALGGPCYCSYDPLEREPEAAVGAQALVPARSRAWGGCQE